MSVNIKVFNLYYPIRNVVFFITETILIFLSIFVASIIKIRIIDNHVFVWMDVWPKVGLITFVCILSLYYHDLYEFAGVYGYGELFIRLLQSLGISCLLLAGIYTLFPQLIIAERVFMFALLLIVSFILSWRLVYNWILKGEKFKEKILILGSGPFAHDIIKETEKRENTGFKVLGVLSNTNSLSFTENVPVLGRIKDILLVTRKFPCERIVLALSEQRRNLPLSELLELKLKGKIIQDGVEFYEHLTGKIMIEKLRPSYFIFSNGFKISKFRQRVKRLLDICLSLIGLGLSMPICAIIAILIKLDSKGPVLFKQERVGEEEIPFILYKFRSMHINAERDRPIWAKENDPRVTRIGRIIRKMRMDEIPQMLNVLKGEMSFVGPRPERPYFVKRLKEQIPYYSQRHAVKPGITGWAQIRYRYGDSVQDAIEKLKYDLYYIKNMSFLFDLAILFETTKVLLLKKGAR